MQLRFKLEQLLLLAFQQLRHRNAGPLGDHFADLLLGDVVAQQFVLHRFCGPGQLPLQLGNAAVLQLRHAPQITAAPSGFKLGAGRLQFLLDVLGTAQAGLLGLPDILQAGVLGLQGLHTAQQVFKAALAGVVALLLERLHLHLLLDETPLQPVHGLRLGVDLHANAAGRLINQVNGLVRQLPVGDVAMRQPRGGDDGRVRDVHGVVQLIAFLQAPEDGDGVLHARLIHQHLLETALQGGILFDMLAILIQCGRTDAVQLSPGQGGLEHVAGVHGTLCLAGPDHGVQLIDKEDDAALLLGELIQHGLQPLLEFAAKLGAGDQRAHVEGQNALALQPLRHLAIENPLRQALDDGGLAHPGFTDQHRIVLGAPLQHLDGAANLVIAPDHRVELALLRPFGKIDAVLGERLPVLLRIGVLHRIPCPSRLNDGL